MDRITIVKRKPRSTQARRGPKTCPVCGEVSYSAAGVHPQCSVRQSDEKLREIIKEEGIEEKKTEKVARNVTRWQKACPKCSAKQHVRKKVCDCGHKFIIRTESQGMDLD